MLRQSVAGSNVILTEEQIQRVLSSLLQETDPDESVSTFLTRELLGNYIFSGHEVQHWSEERSRERRRGEGKLLTRRWTYMNGRECCTCPCVPYALLTANKNNISLEQLCNTLHAHGLSIAETGTFCAAKEASSLIAPEQGSLLEKHEKS